MRNACSRAVSALLGLVIVLALAGCAAPSTGGSPQGSGGGTAGNNAIAIKNFSFEPAGLEVKAGTAVTWTNQDSTDHTVTADDNSFNSQAIAPGATFSFTFQKAGTYKYHCSIHPSMVGQVVVK
jgi:plastocyanin